MGEQVNGHGKPVYRKHAATGFIPVAVFFIIWRGETWTV